MNRVVPAALSAAILLSLSPATRAADATELDAVQVTATRLEKPLDEALASVTVLDRGPRTISMRSICSTGSCSSAT